MKFSTHIALACLLAVVQAGPADSQRLVEKRLAIDGPKGNQSGPKRTSGYFDVRASCFESPM